MTKAKAELPEPLASDAGPGANAPAAPVVLANPTAGGSYTRKPDGSLVKRKG